MRYQVVGVLGRGGQAVVELAVDPTGRRVAVKRLPLTGSAVGMAVERRRLRREAEILGSLAHPGIVPVLDVVDDGCDLLVVFPALAENLEDRVARLGPLGPDEVRSMGRVLLEALAAAHRAGVVHRDVKPANVLFDGEGRPAIADFGVAVTWELTGGLTRAGTVVGSPAWMAPEQACGEPSGPAADVFSLGATLVYAATGEGPYRPGPAATMMERASRGDVRPVPGWLPADLSAPLTRMLAVAPSERPSAAALLGGPAGTDIGAPAAGRPAGPDPHDGGVPRLRRGPGAVVARVLGDPPERTRARRSWPVAVGLVVASVGLALVLVAGRPAPPGRVRATATCTPLRYLPCGSSTPAPHTDGTACDPGWYDLDGRAADGCEAHSEYRPGTVLVSDAPVRANLVPGRRTDSFSTRVSGDALDLCWGALHVTLTAPAGTAEVVAVWHGTQRSGSAVSADGAPATVTVPKPSCFGADSEDLQVTVTSVAGDPPATAADFVLTRDGGW